MDVDKENMRQNVFSLYEKWRFVLPMLHTPLLSSSAIVGEKDIKGQAI